MRQLAAVPLPLRVLATAGLVGFILGLLLAALSGGQLNRGSSVNLGQPWTLREPPFDTLMESLLTSKHWSRGAAPAVEEEVVEPEPEIPGRPGIFKYLKLVAILREPGLEAVLRLEKMPDAMRELMVSSPDETGLVHLQPGSVVTEGWVVSGLSDTYLQITGIESDEIVEYRLFQWD